MSGAGLTLRAQRRGELLLVAASGLGTVQTAAHLRAYVTAQVSKAPTIAAIVDVRKVAHAIGHHAWQEIEQHASGAYKVGLPVAYVVASVDEEAYEHHCDRMGHHGLLRATFTVMEDALRWASQLAAAAPGASAL